MAITSRSLHLPIELRSIDPGQNRFRRYRMTEQPTLFAAVDLIVEWGRLGSIPRVRIERFTDDARLAARRRELLARRRLHGYQEQFQQEEETTADARPTSPMAGVPALG